MSITAFPSAPRLILASASPRRQQLLREAGYEFTVYPAEVNEEDYARGTLPAEVALQLARRKAAAVAAAHRHDVVLAADTVVAFGDMVLGKPHDAADARQMLGLLSGTTHIVITGVAVNCIDAGYSRSTRVMSAVRMRGMSAKEIEDYVESGAWQGKAGAYGIQDNDPVVERISGDHTNIVGLPMPKTIELLKGAGIEPARPPSQT